MVAGVGFAFKGGPVLWGVVLVVAAAPPRHRQALRVCVCVCVCGASKIPFGLQQSPLIMSVKMQLRLFLSTPGDTLSPPHGGVEGTHKGCTVPQLPHAHA